MQVSNGTIRLSATSTSLWAAEPRRAPPVRPTLRHWLKTWLLRRPPTTYQRCLAVHIHYAGPRSALS